MAARSRSRRDDRDDTSASPRSDAYTGILVLSLVAQIVGAVFLFLDYKEYPEPKPSPPPAAAAPAAPAVPPPAPKAGG